MINNSCVVIGEGEDVDIFNNSFPVNVDKVVNGRWAFIKNNFEKEPRFYFEFKKDLMVFKLTFQKD